MCEAQAESSCQAGTRSGKEAGFLAKMAIFDPFLGQFSNFSAIFPPFSRWGQDPFSGFLLPFRAGGPIWGLYRAIGIATPGDSLLIREK